MTEVADSSFYVYSYIISKVLPNSIFYFLLPVFDITFSFWSLNEGMTIRELFLVGQNKLGRVRLGLVPRNGRTLKLWSYPCGNFSDTSSLKLLKTKGSIGHAFTVCIHTENQNQVSFYPFVLHEISVLIELTLGHLRYHLTDVPPQPNSQPDSVFDTDRPANGALILENEP